MNKKILGVFVLVFVIFVTGCGRKNNNEDTLDKIMQRGKIVVGVKYDAKPFGYLNAKGEPVGYDVDLAHKVAGIILGDENKIEFKPVTSSNRILKLSRGDVDMLIATMTITKPRQRIVDFSVPYYMTGQSIMVNKGSKITSMSDLNGKKAIVIFGSTAENNLKLLAPNAEIIGFKTYTSGYKALKSGLADAMVSDDSILLGFTIDDSSVKLLAQKYSLAPYAIAFRKSHLSGRFLNKVNFALEYLKNSGELNSLNEKWLKK